MQDRMPQVVQPVQTLDGYLTRQAWRWLAPLAAVAVVFVAWTVHDVHRHQVDELRTIARNIASAADVDLTRRAQGLQGVVAGVLQSQIQTSLATWYEHAKGYDITFDSAVVLVDVSRQMLFNSRLPLGTVLPRLPNPKGQPVFDEAMATGQARFGNVTVGPVLRRPVVSVIVPVQGNSDRIALMGLVPVAQYQDLLLREVIPSGWHAAIFDGAGQRIAATRDDLLPAADVQLAHRHVSQSERAQWTIVVQADPKAFYRPHVQVGAGMVVTLAVAFFGAVMAARRAREGLVAAASQLVAGEKTPPGSQTGRDGAAVPRIAEIESVHEALARLELARREAEHIERDRIARDLHDGLQQQAAAVKLHLDMALEQLPAEAPATELVQVGRSEIHKLIKSVDDTVHNLRPGALELMGLSGALGEMVDQTAAVSGMQCELEVVGGEAADALPKALAECLYRVLQETMNNVRKHAHATFVHVVLDASNPRQVTLNVSDDGVGVDNGQRRSRPGMGLAGMLRRVELLGGVLDIRQGQPGDAASGTTVAVWLPVGVAAR